MYQVRLASSDHQTLLGLSGQIQELMEAEAEIVRRAILEVHPDAARDLDSRQFNGEFSRKRRPGRFTWMEKICTGSRECICVCYAENDGGICFVCGSGNDQAGEQGMGEATNLSS